MRLGVISDIHGNLPALDAVLADIARRGVDATVNVGDSVSGPLLPAETADRLIPLALPTIRGNHERQLLEFARDAMGPTDRHAADVLRPAHWAWIRATPATLWLGDDVFVCHGVPANDMDYFLHVVDERGVHPADDALVATRAGDCRASLILCGHSHLPRVVRLPDGRTVVNPGSVGLQAFDWDRPLPHVVSNGSPHARYAVVERVPNGWSVEQYEVEYDWEPMARLAESNGRPEWAAALRTGALG
jgi:predicted phosphodiesterase